MSLCLGETKITPCIHSALLQDKNVTITENGIQSVVADNQYNGLREVTINTNVVGDLMEKDVNFYDYDGTLLYSYSKTDFLALSAMPENPSHEGLVAQGWNWDLADAQDYVEDYGILDIGQMYATSSEKVEIDICLTPAIGLNIHLYKKYNEVNWGDGTIDSNDMHTYSDYGNYTISYIPNTTNINTIIGYSNENVEKKSILAVRFPNGVLDLPSFSDFYSLEYLTLPKSATNFRMNFCYNCFRLKSITIPKNCTASLQYSSNPFQNCRSLKNLLLPKGLPNLSSGAMSGNYSLKRLTLPNSFNNLTIGGTYYFQNSPNLKELILTEGIVSFGERLCYGDKALEFVNLPSTLTAIPTSAFESCWSLKKIDIPENVSLIGASAFSSCTSLKSIKIPKGIITIQASIFSNCINLKVFDFSLAEQVPILSNTNAFYEINKLTKIIVPDALYEDWIVASNWTTYADYIVKESDYNA